MIKLKNLLPECENCGRDWNHGHDHEASMAHGELKDAISNASKIQNMIGDNDNLPGWVSSYITLASDYFLQKNQGCKITAYTFKANQASFHSFQKAGYIFSEEKEIKNIPSCILYKV